jgi:hypothetical protein
MGVSDRRVKQLLRLVRSTEPLKEKRNGAAPEEAGSKVSRAKGKTPAKKRTASASRKRPLVARRQKHTPEVFLNIPYDKKFERLFLAFISGTIGSFARGWEQDAIQRARIQGFMRNCHRCGGGVGAMNENE